MHDILPADMPAWHALEATASEVFRGYGFEEIRVPLLEKTELFARAIGGATDVVEKEMYTFEDRNGESLSLRPEGTAGIVRAVLQNGLLYGPPLRVWYSGAMFRRERPQKGRMRQFHQIGAEVFGAHGPDIDAELIAMGERLWRKLGLQGLRLEINSLGDADERASYREELVKYLAGVADRLDDETRQRMQRNPLRVLDSKDKNVLALLADAPVMIDFLGPRSAGHFEELRRLLDSLNVSYEINPRLVRGLDYYSHTVFEWISGELGAQATVCAGGRYDGLVEIQGGKPWPGIGFAMGQERLVELINKDGRSAARVPHVYLVLAGERAKAAGMKLAEGLRDELPRLQIVCNTGEGSFKSQFKRADRSGAKLALVIGEDELGRGEATIKRLREDAPQETVGIDSISGWLADWLK